MACINDKEMLEAIITDLIDNRGYNHDDAEIWAKEHGETIVSDMWDAYSSYIEMNSDYKGNDDE